MDTPQVKDLVFLVIHICPTLKGRESVGRRAKLAVIPRKIHLPTRDTCFVNKMSLGGETSSKF